MFVACRVSAASLLFPAMITAARVWCYRPVHVVSVTIAYNMQRVHSKHSLLQETADAVLPPEQEPLTAASLTAAAAAPHAHLWHAD
jgi:hypothetical protein